ncbi:MAG: tRNA 2-selenouridine(34) synthase MnmH [Ferruginibacter sp.]
MAIKKTDTALFLQHAQLYPVLDVRSPGEYDHAHIPGAFSLPLFDNEQRKIIGTAYKQQSREKAIKAGLDFFGPKMKAMVEAVEQITKSLGQKQVNTLQDPESPIVLVHCWRGGMRSNAVAWLLNLYGFNVYLLDGGYKAYRNHVLQQFEKDYVFKIVGGYTGSGKTYIIQQLQNLSQPVIDLEGLASHKGSAFGGIGLPPQPSQEMFENLLAKALQEKTTTEPTWLEDESQRIGRLNIPHGLWNTMRQCQVCFLDIPFKERLDHIMKEYSNLDKDRLEEAITRIQKRLGPLQTKTALGFLLNEDLKSCFDILLKYYDKNYLKSLHNREKIDALLNKIPASAVDSISNTEKLLACEMVKK